MISANGKGYIRCLPTGDRTGSRASAGKRLHRFPTLSGVGWKALEVEPAAATARPLVMAPADFKSAQCAHEKCAHTAMPDKKYVAGLVSFQAPSDLFHNSGLGGRGRFPASDAYGWVCKELIGNLLEFRRRKETRRASVALMHLWSHFHLDAKGVGNRQECLNAAWFLSVADARSRLSEWRDDYNQNRPHSALGNLTPSAFAALLEPARKVA